jgi:Transport and Golgi organisation 2
MCSIVVQWAEGQPTRILALRDELVGRDFDDPGRWWPEFPDVVGGRDRTAGGTWCASRVGTGATALVVNRPQKPTADPGAPSRGIVPLLAASYGDAWVSRLDLAGMASFALVLATPHRLTVWAFDGDDLAVTEYPEGTHMVTSGGAEDGKAPRYLRRFAGARFPEEWRDLAQAQPPSDDPAALVVRRERDGQVFATVFGELIDARPGAVDLEFAREPWRARSWVSTPAWT